MTNTYTETSKNISDVILNEMQTYQFEEEVISDEEYSIVPLDDNFLQIATIKWVSTGQTNTIPLGCTVKSKEQILYVMVATEQIPYNGFMLAPDMYTLNDTGTGVILPRTPQENKEIYYIKILNGLFFTGIQGGTT